MVSHFYGTVKTETNVLLYRKKLESDFSENSIRGRDHEHFNRTTNSVQYTHSTVTVKKTTLHHANFTLAT